ncbi:MAG: hypothetical protein JSU07_14000 [Bacteroidetes bacterium]|nr:hypothetical protein [Bacteroidota bacterium]
MANQNTAYQYFHPGCMETLPIIGKPKVSEQMFDDFKNKLLSNIVENTAPGKLDVHTSDLIMKSILITGPRLIKRGGVELIHKKGKDNIIRFNLINVCILLFTNNQMLYFNCCYDLISEKVSLVSTEEFFYKDIVSTSTDTIETTYEDKEGKVQKLETADCFRVRTSGGTAIEVVLTSPKLLELWGGGVIPTDFIEDAISKIRKILRDKKQA